jgi:ferredoxin
VAVVGAGPAGLSAVYFLLQAGHDCTVFDANEEAGGSLREISADKLPREVLAAEIELIERTGARFSLGKRIDNKCGVDELRGQFDAVLIATGKDVAGGLLHADRTTHETEVDGVFAAGEVTRAFGEPGRAAADGKAAAMCIDQFLCGAPVAGRRKPTALRMTRPQISQSTKNLPRVVPRGEHAGFTDEEARAEALRCLHCDCHKLDTCRLRKYAEMYGADGRRYRGPRRRIGPREEHAGVVYEPGKCILCGLCVQIAQAAGETLGLAFIGRGFDVRVGVPFNEPLSEALRSAAKECIAACPTGALSAPEPHETLQGAAPKQ